MTIERASDEVAYDPMFKNFYLATREDLIEGRRVATVLAFGASPDEVHATIRIDRTGNPSAIYRFYKPLEEGKNREGWTIGGGKLSE